MATRTLATAALVGTMLAMPALAQGFYQPHYLPQLQYQPPVYQPPPSPIPQYLPTVPSPVLIQPYQNHSFSCMTINNFTTCN